MYVYVFFVVFVQRGECNSYRRIALYKNFIIIFICRKTWISWLKCGSPLIRLLHCNRCSEIVSVCKIGQAFSNTFGKINGIVAVV